MEKIKKELEDERNKTLTELGQLEQKARRDEIEKEGYQREAAELKKRLAKTEEARFALIIIQSE